MGFNEIGQSQKGIVQRGYLRAEQGPQDARIFEQAMRIQPKGGTKLKTGIVGQRRCEWGR
jgi:hypothetical protein